MKLFWGDQVLSIKRWTAFVLVLAILSGILSFAAAASDQDMTPANDKGVSRTQFNVREERNLESAKLRNVEWGKQLKIIGYFDDGWLPQSCVSVFSNRYKAETISKGLLSSEN